MYLIPLPPFLQESDEIPADYTRLFEHRLFSISTSLVPSSIRAYDQLGVKHEQLRLISPQFETPLPPLAAAVFPPTFRELSNPQVKPESEKRESGTGRRAGRAYFSFGR